MSSVDTSQLKALGENSKVDRSQFDGPHPDVLESFPSPFADSTLNEVQVRGWVEIETREFTSLCPKTGQPDFATIKIRYVPRLLCVESKSLKLYLMSFRNVGEFHEACTMRICNDLVKLLRPILCEVKGEFTPRGGIPFWPTAVYEDPAGQGITTA